MNFQYSYSTNFTKINLGKYTKLFFFWIFRFFENTLGLFYPKIDKFLIRYFCLQVQILKKYNFAGVQHFYPKPHNCNILTPMCRKGVFKFIIKNHQKKWITKNLFVLREKLIIFITFFHNRINHNYDSQYTYRIINFYVFWFL